MCRQQMVWSLAIVATVLVLMATAPVRADVVAANMLLYLDAADSDGNGGAANQGSGTTWASKAGTAINHDGTVKVAGGGSGGSDNWIGSGITSDPYARRSVTTAAETAAARWKSPTRSTVQASSACSPIPMKFGPAAKVLAPAMDCTAVY